MQSELAERLAKLSPAKRALLDLQLKSSAGPAARGTIPRRPGRGPWPLSFAQQRLWFLSQLEPESDAYHESSALRLTGALDVAALQAALGRLAARHEILRSRIIVANDVPVSIVDPRTSIAVRETDLRATPKELREAAVRQLIEEEIRRPFDFAAGPLMRGLLLRLSDADHVLLFVRHHIITDGWSSSIFWRELAAFYREANGGGAADLPELPIQYQDYAEWQREYLQGDVLAAQLTYWKKQLEGIRALKLPADASAVYRGNSAASQTILLPIELWRSLAALSREQNATLFMTLLAAFQLLLGRYSGREDVAVGSPIAGRTREELEGLIGFFVNTLVLRTDLSGDPTFLQLLERVREVCLGAYDHQELPFEKLVEELKPARSQTESPLFQVIFALRNTPRRRIDLPGLAVSQIETSQQTAKFDLYLGVYEETDGLRCTFQYNAGLYGPDLIERMGRGFRALLEAAVADPRQTVSTLPIMSAAERRRLLVEWNDTKTDYAADKCIHEVFESQVERSLDAIAVSYGGKQLTYRELNRRANGLACALRQAGVGPDTLVGICVERSLEMVVGLLAIVKAGGAYVPLDPAYPKERLSFMLRDTQASVVLTRQGLLERLPEHDAEVIFFDSASEPASDNNLFSGVTPDHLAYVMYTSGTTGTPKGVAVPHRAVNRLVLNGGYACLNPSDVVAQASNASFDAATFEIWGALLNGSKLVGLSTNVVLSPHELAAHIESERITTLFLTTGLFNQIAVEHPTTFKHLRHLLVGGEAMDPKSVSRILKHGPPERLLNVYGPTESTTFTTTYVVKDVPEGATSIPIGRPISNTQVYLFDRHLQPVPVGVIGELFIGGDGLAREYLDRPQLTAEKFVAHPFGQHPRERLYKTGDFGRYLPDGNIEFLGRVDDQVKIRGFRIELGEIETALRRHPGVREAVVVAREIRPGERQLIGYIVASDNLVPSVGELRQFLRDALPPPMIPTSWVFLPSLPLAATGKIDRIRLPMPDADRVDDGRGYVKPADPVECQLAEIWEALLSVHPIGVTDDFFDMGGHSLLALQLMQRIEQTFAKRIPLATLFTRPTVRGLAKLLVEEHSARFKRPIFEVQPGRGKDPIFFVHGDYGGGGIYSVGLARELGEEQPFYVLNPLETNGMGPTTIEEMAAVYIRIIRSVRGEGPYLLGGYCNGGVLAYEIARQLREQKQPVELVAVISARLKRNPGMMLLRGCVALLGRLRRLEPAAKTRFFYRTVELYVYYRNRLEQVIGSPLRAQLVWLLGLLKGVFLTPPNLPSTSGRQNVEPLAGMGLTLEAYVPRRYSGRVVLFQPENKGHSGEKSAVAEWRRIVSDLELQAVPGDHLSCVSTHGRTLARLLKSRLEMRSSQA
jgi:amino acid adenylation domain-containing protein